MNLFEIWNLFEMKHAQFNIFIIFPIILIAGVFLPGVSPAADIFHPGDLLEVRISNLSREDIISLYHKDVDIDGVWGDIARAYVFSDQLDELRKLGYDIDIIPDQRPRDEMSEGYPSNSELTAALETVESEYPDLCRLHNIGFSEEGREIWAMNISDNVGVEEDEPEFKYISTMHGDEPVGMIFCLNLIRLLADSYGTDPQTTMLVNEIDIWIMPLMNPDGYANGSRYNSYREDLNRNFPDRIEGPVNTTDGRPAETQAVMNWSFIHSFVLSANFHTGALVVNYPYDSDPDPLAPYSATPDDNLFIEQSLTYASLNEPMYNGRFDQGITNGMSWYFVPGGMQDWNYVWMGCNEVTVEVSDEKWPPYSEVPDLWNDNRKSMLAYMAWCLRGVRGKVTDSTTGQPLDATVSVVGPEYHNDHNVFTDPDVGDYHRMLLPGTYSIRFSAQGYQPLTVPGVVVDDEEAVRVDAALFPGNINNDDATDLGDVILAAQVLTGTKTAEPLHTEADVNNDGRIGLEEAIYALRKVSEKR